MNTVIDALLARRSCPKLTEPAPSREQLELIINTALNAPDHGRIKPWRYLIIQGEGRQALGELFASALDKDASESQIEKMRAAPLRAPLILVAVAKILPDHPKAPVVEQIESTAAGVQNLLLAAQSLGYGCMWRTGAMAFNSLVKQGLDLEERDEIVGFIYIGTPESEPKAPEAPVYSELVAHWPN